MGKGNRQKFMIPQKQLPAVVRAKQMEDKIRELCAKNDKLRRLLWMAVREAGGRIEIEEEVFRETVDEAKMPAEDTLIKYEPQESGGKKVVVIVHCDEEGNTIEDPGPRRIIVPKGMGG